MKALSELTEAVKAKRTGKALLELVNTAENQISLLPSNLSSSISFAKDVMDKTAHEAETNARASIQMRITEMGIKSIDGDTTKLMQVSDTPLVKVSKALKIRMVKMKNEVFKSVVQVKVELNSNLLSANVPQELLIISPHPLSDTTLLLFSHDKLISALKQDESLSTIYKFLSEDNDSINHVRLEMDMGVLKFNILKKNELLYDLTPNINVLDLIEEVRLFAPSTQPRAGIFGLRH